MIVAGQRLPILIATRPVDFRCGHRALALIVQTELKLDPHSGVTIVFRSKRGDRLKILVWEDEEDQETVRGDRFPDEWARDDLQDPGTGQLCLTQGAGRGDAAVAGPV